MKLELRPRTEREVRIYFARTRDPEIQARIPQRSQTVEQALEDYRRSAAPGADSYGRTVWADGVYVGDIWCYCIHAEADPDAMVSYCLFDKDCWGQGIASRALEQFLADAGPRFGLKRVGAFTYADNPASVRVLEKNGFTIREAFEDEGRQSFYLERDIGNKEEVQMDYIVENNRIAGEQDGKVLAEITFPEKEPGVVVIDHTWVDPSLRGQGAAGQLVRRAANAIRQSGRKARVTCSYARTWFEKHPEETDVLAEGWQSDPAACRLGR